MIAWIIILIVLEGLVAIRALKWALPRSNASFYSIFAADALLKLLGLAFVTGWLWIHHMPYVGPLLTLGFGYLLMSLLQIPFLYKAR